MRGFADMAHGFGRNPINPRGAVVSGGWKL